MTRKEQWIKIDNFKRKYYLKNEIKYQLLKSTTKNNYLLLLYKFFFFFFKIKINHFNFKIKHLKRCLQTGRIKSTLNFTKCSRFVTRFKIYDGNLPGFKRLSW